MVKIDPSTQYQDFDISIKGLTAFAVENIGNTLLLLSFDKGSGYIKVKPEEVREFVCAAGNVYTGNVQGKFGEVVQEEGTETEERNNEALIIRSIFICEK